LLTPLEDIRDAATLVEGERIVAAGRQTNKAVPDGYEVWDVGGEIVMPGFVDIDSHGGHGFYAREGDEAVQAISRSLVTTT